MEYVRPEISTLDSAYDGVGSSAGTISIVVSFTWSWVWVVS